MCHPFQYQCMPCNGTPWLFDKALLASWCFFQLLYLCKRRHLFQKTQIMAPCLLTMIIMMMRAENIQFIEMIYKLFCLFKFSYFQMRRHLSPWELLHLPQCIFRRTSVPLRSWSCLPSCPLWNGASPLHKNLHPHPHLQSRGPSQLSQVWALSPFFCLRFGTTISD